MMLSKRIVLFIKVIIIICTLTSIIKINTEASKCINIENEKISNIAVMLRGLDNSYSKQFKKDLETLGDQHKDKIKYTFFDQKNNASVEHETIDLVTRSGFNLIIALLVDISEDPVKDFILKAKNKNIPLILININPKVIERVSKYYDKVVFISVSPQDAGRTQGKMIANMWNSNKNIMDKNKDGILQYVLLKGGYMSEIADQRTKSSILEINNSSIKTEELELIYCDWSRELAKNAIQNVFLKFYDRIEVIISNNDDMAIGALEGIQKYGYNTGDKLKYIPIFGVGSISDARELIDKGLLAGTVIEDSKKLAEDTYIIGMNLINNFPPLKNTNLKLQDNEVKLLTNPNQYTNSDIFK